MGDSKKKAVIFYILSIIYIASQLISGCSGADTVKKKNVTATPGNQHLIELGRFLFYDRRLSVNYTRSCGTCHNPDFAFTDGYKRSLGAFADLHQHNTQPLFNLAYLKYLTASDSGLHLAIQQMNNPLFSDHPVEMGVKGHEGEILLRISSEKMYKDLFDKCFPDDKQSMNWNNIKKAISSFLYTLISKNSAYDKYQQADSTALSEAQKKGMKLFFSDQLKCASCHGGDNFSTPSLLDKNKDTIFYFNTGIYNVDAKGSYPEYDRGLYQLTKYIGDMGKFRVPTLRNLTFTAPYFHDGSAASLTEVIDIYSKGGREITKGVNAGNGKTNPYKHPFINGFTITEENKKDLVNFLLSLTDSSFVNDPSIRNPFNEDETKKKY